MTNEHTAGRTDEPVPATTEADDLTDEDEVAFPTTFYPAADITPVQFEESVVELLKSMEAVAGVPPVVTLHEKVQGTDGEYDFDATARFDWGGMQFLVLAEAKLHQKPIKRELVQVLHSMLSSVGPRRPSCFRQRLTRRVLSLTPRLTASRWPRSPKAGSPMKLNPVSVRHLLPESRRETGGTFLTLSPTPTRRGTSPAQRPSC